MVIAVALNGAQVVPTGNVENNYMEVYLMHGDDVDLSRKFWISTGDKLIEESHNYKDKK